MSEGKPISAKYICLDIVEYTYNRPVEAQLDIRDKLDEIVKISIARNLPEDKEKLKYLPTGDGMCIALLNIYDPVDIHLLVALSILKGVSDYNNTTEDEEFQFQVRIGIDARTDQIVTDINGNENIAGAGINEAFRIMGVADGKQILVSQSVYGELCNSRKYRTLFKRFGAIVRHGIPLTVYQFTGEAEGLDNEKVPKHIQEYSDFIRPAITLGLKKVYDFRDEAVKAEIIQDIDNAKARVWLLGVGLSEKLDIKDHTLLQKLESKINDAVEVKILLLNGLQSPAVFRTFLESSCEDISKIIETERTNRRGLRTNKTYSEHSLYRSFKNAWEELELRLKFQDKVRFYAHAPSCWLAIVDDKAYFQPYTFGDQTNDSNSRSSSSQMPIIKLQGQTEPFGLVEDHFSKLWLTSDVDLFHMGARIKIKETILSKVFEERFEWFEHIYGVVCESAGKDRRNYPRQPCISPRMVATVRMEDGQKIDTKIVNMSHDSALLELKSAADSERFPSLAKDKEIIVRLDIRSGKRSSKSYRSSAKDLAAEYLVKKLLEPSNHKFKFIRKYIREDEKERNAYIALQAYKE